MPRVTVILPTRNRPDALAEALASVRAQTFEDTEVVVVNDAGAPVSEVVEAFQTRMVVRLVDLKQNNGVAGARNEGLRAARGEIIAYLDDDDIFHPEHLETLVDVLSGRDGPGAAYTDAELARYEMRGGGRHVLERKLVYSCPFSAASLLVNNYIPCVCLGHRREMLDRAGFFDESLPGLEDWDLAIRLSLITDLVHVPKVTAEYRKHVDPAQRENLATRRKGRFLRNVAAVYTKYADLARSRPRVLEERARYLLHVLEPLVREEAESGIRGKAGELSMELGAALDVHVRNPNRLGRVLERVMVRLADWRD